MDVFITSSLLGSINILVTVIQLRTEGMTWMKSYAQVFDHPYFAVTGKDGSFSIKNVPDGTYKAVAWQERFNKRTLSQSVTVKGGKATLNFTLHPINLTSLF